MSLPGWPQGVVQHPWDPMVEIPTPPERGCGRLSYVWLCCSCVEHREDSHPMCGDAWNCTCRICTIIWLTTSVWPSVWGWKAVDLVSLVSNSDQRLDQNVLRNRLSRSEMMVCGIPKCTHTHSKKSLVVASVVMLFLQVAIIAILEK
jgi:hypothetical protein